LLQLKSKENPVELGEQPREEESLGSICKSSRNRLFSSEEKRYGYGAGQKWGRGMSLLVSSAELRAEVWQTARRSRTTRG